MSRDARCATCSRSSQPRRLLLGMGTRFIEGFTFNLFSVFLLAYVVTNLDVCRSRGR